MNELKSARQIWGEMPEEKRAELEAIIAVTGMDKEAMFQAVDTVRDYTQRTLQQLREMTGNWFKVYTLAKQYDEYQLRIRRISHRKDKSQRKRLRRRRR